ncbi:hypothetical protein D3C76_1530460 [compost metagenome]
MVRHAGCFKAFVGPATHHYDGDDCRDDTNHECPESIRHLRRWHVQTTTANKEGVAEIMTVARPRHGQKDREVPKQDLQQRWNISENFYIYRRQLGNDPVL